MPYDSRGRESAGVLVPALLTAASVRLVASVVAGFAMLTTPSESFPGRHDRAGQILTSFGSAGDTLEVLLLVGALALVLWRARVSPAAVFRGWLVLATLATALLVVSRVTGVLVFTSDFSGGAAVSQQAEAVGFGVADLVVCAALLVAARRSEDADERALVSGDDPVLFAVDRKTADVRAFLSPAEARRGISVYSIEDDEFAFYDDEGHVVTAEVVDGWTVFTHSDVDREDELLAALRRFAAENSLDVADPDDPLTYVQPIKSWQRRRT